MTPAQRKVAELSCRNITVLAGTAVDRGLERGPAVDHVTGWDKAEKEQVGEEKTVSFIGSPMCQTFDLIMVMRDTDGLSDVKYDNLEERFGRNAGRLFLRKNLWDRWSPRGSVVKEMTEKERENVHNTK